MKNVKISETFLNFNNDDFFLELLGYLDDNPFDTNAQLAILAAYESYKKNKNNLESLDPIIFSPTISTEKWDAVYRKLRYRLKKKWKELLGEDNIPSRCPSCGISTPNQAEHFLSRANYREFSLLPINLIPWCDICNSKKGTNIVDDFGVRLFVNCYWDEIDKYCFWKCEVDIIHSQIFFHIVRPTECPSNLFKIIDNHSRKLELAKRFIRSAEEEVRKFVIETKLRQAANISFLEIKKLLQTSITSSAMIKGNNHWETVLYQGIYDCLDINQLNYIYNTTRL